MKDQLITWLNKKGIHFFLGLVLVLIVIGALSTFYIRTNIHEQESHKELAHKVILNMNQMTSFILIGDVGTRGYMLIQEDRFAAPLMMAREQYLGKLNEIETQLTQQKYPELDTLQLIKEDIGNYMDLLSSMYQDVK